MHVDKASTPLDLLITLPAFPSNCWFLKVDGSDLSDIQCTLLSDIDRPDSDTNGRFIARGPAQYPLEVWLAMHLYRGLANGVEPDYHMVTSRVRW